jgi:hypothetical protein
MENGRRDSLFDALGIVPTDEQKQTYISPARFPSIPPSYMGGCMDLNDGESTVEDWLGAQDIRLISSLQTKPHLLVFALEYGPRKVIWFEKNKPARFVFIDDSQFLDDEHIQAIGFERAIGLYHKIDECILL